MPIYSDRKLRNNNFYLNENELCNIIQSSLFPYIYISLSMFRPIVAVCEKMHPLILERQLCWHRVGNDWGIKEN